MDYANMTLEQLFAQADEIGDNFQFDPEYDEDLSELSLEDLFALADEIGSKYRD